MGLNVRGKDGRFIRRFAGRRIREELAYSFGWCVFSLGRDGRTFLFLGGERGL